MLGVLTLAGPAACASQGDRPVPAAPAASDARGATATSTPLSPRPTSAPRAGSARSTANPTSVHLTAAGDYGATANTAGVLEALAAGGSDAHLALGDLSYGSAGGEQAWCSFVTSHVGTTFPFQLLAGNHESSGGNGSIDRFEECLPNRLPGIVGQYARQYYVDLPHAAPLVRVVLISPALTFPDGTWHYTAGSARYAWTAAAIDGARRAGIRWVVVAMHESCLTMGRYGCPVGPDLLHLLVSERVDVVLSGHEHLYQRTKQLREGEGCGRVTVGSYSPACVVDADASMVAGAGTVFATVGTGGVDLRPVSATSPESGYFATASGTARNPTYGFADLRVTSTELRFGFVRGAGGTFTDEWVLGRMPSR